MMKLTRKLRLAVIGPSDADAATLALAEDVGTEIARHGAILICGGLSGVMESAARGARQAGGLTVGILPGTDARDANAYIDVPVVTGMGEARNVIIARTADAVIAIGGAYGTLSEIALALRGGVPVVGLGTWQLRAPDGSVPPIVSTRTATDAVQAAVTACRR
jgi:uncharacterized protein (TIGR00725 family)